jgi:hypothetical protein
MATDGWSAQSGSDIKTIGRQVSKWGSADDLQFRQAEMSTEQDFVN